MILAGRREYPELESGEIEGDSGFWFIVFKYNVLIPSKGSKTESSRPLKYIETDLSRRTVMLSSVVQVWTSKSPNASMKAHTGNNSGTWERRSRSDFCCDLNLHQDPLRFVHFVLADASACSCTMKARFAAWVLVEELPPDVACPIADLSSWVPIFLAESRSTTNHSLLHLAWADLKRDLQFFSDATDCEIPRRAGIS